MTKHAIGRVGKRALNAKIKSVNREGYLNKIKFLRSENIIKNVMEKGEVQNKGKIFHLSDDGEDEKKNVKITRKLNLV